MHMIPPTHKRTSTKSFHSMLCVKFCSLTETYTQMKHHMRASCWSRYSVSQESSSDHWFRQNWDTQCRNLLCFKWWATMMESLATPYGGKHFAALIHRVNREIINQTLIQDRKIDLDVFLQSSTLSQAKCSPFFSRYFYVQWTSIIASVLFTIFIRVFKSILPRFHFSSCRLICSTSLPMKLLNLNSCLLRCFVWLLEAACSFSLSLNKQGLGWIYRPKNIGADTKHILLSTKYRTAFEHCVQYTNLLIYIATLHLFNLVTVIHALSARTILDPGHDEIVDVKQLHQSLAAQKGLLVGPTSSKVFCTNPIKVFLAWSLLAQTLKSTFLP